MTSVFHNRLRIVAALTLAAIVLLAAMPSAKVNARQGKQKQEKKQEKKPTPGQQQPKDDQTIRLGTQLVNVLFSVTDKQNHYINDLTKTDVTILEDGRPQDIFTFKREMDLPLTMAILIDVSGSERYTLPQLKDAGGRFIDSVIKAGKDTAAVVKFEGEATLMQGLTSNTSRLRRALDEVAFIAGPPPSVYGGATPPINGGSRQNGTSIYDSIIAACTDLLAREPGRKTIILLTDGEDTTSRLKLGDAVDEALKAEVVIYAIGIGDPGFGGINDGVLKKLTEQTGGRAFMPKSNTDLDHAFADLERDLRQQYLLAYEPANDNSDGTFRKIEVRVNNRKDLHVRNRRGYYAPKA
jgi:Ca-activated chloride channel homolog